MWSDRRLRSFSPEVGRHLAPLSRLPFYDWVLGGVVGAEPCLCTGYNLKELFGIRGTRKFGLALLLSHPEYGVAAVRVDGLALNALFVEQSQGMDNGKKLADIVCSVYGAEVENLLAAHKVDATVFHRSGISRTRRVDSPRVQFVVHNGAKVIIKADKQNNIFFLLQICLILRSDMRHSRS